MTHKHDYCKITVKYMLTPSLYDTPTTSNFQYLIIVRLGKWDGVIYGQSAVYISIHLLKSFLTFLGRSFSETVCNVTVL